MRCKGQKLTIGERSSGRLSRKGLVWTRAAHRELRVLVAIFERLTEGFNADVARRLFTDEAEAAGESAHRVCHFLNRALYYAQMCDVEKGDKRP